MAPEHTDSPPAPGDSGPDDGPDSRAARDAAHWMALVVMTLAPVILLVAMYVWLKSLNS